jgi:hypothetical protein
MQTGLLTVVIGFVGPVVPSEEKKVSKSTSLQKIGDQEHE